MLTASHHLVLVQELGIHARRRPDLPPRPVGGSRRRRRGRALRREQLPAAGAVRQHRPARVPLGCRINTDVTSMQGEDQALCSSTGLSLWHWLAAPH